MNFKPSMRHSISSSRRNSTLSILLKRSWYLCAPPPVAMTFTPCRISSSETSFTCERIALINAVRTQSAFLDIFFFFLLFLLVINTTIIFFKYHPIILNKIRRKTKGRGGPIEATFLEGASVGNFSEGLSVPEDTLNFSVPGFSF